MESDNDVTLVLEKETDPAISASLTHNASDASRVKGQPARRLNLSPRRAELRDVPKLHGLAPHPE